MKKNFIVSLFASAMLFCTVGVCFAGDEYYCPDQKNGNYYFGGLYDPAGNCEAWNTPFFRRSGSDTYN